MKKVFSFLVLILISALIFTAALFLYDFASRNGRPAAQNESLDQTLIRVLGSDEWVLAKGYYGAIIYDTGGPDKKPITYVEGVVRYGIRVGQLETHTVGDELTILYPAPMPLAIDLKKHLYFPETMDRDQYNAALLEAKPRLVKQALKEGILEEAEQRLQTELPALARELAPGAKVVLRKKGPMP